MEATFCDEQVDAVAERLKGEPTVAPSAGVLTVMSEEAVEEEDGDEGAGLGATTLAGLDAEPPHPVPTAARTVSREKVKAFFRNVTRDPFG
jgi:hypothetical protein